MAQPDNVDALSVLSHGNKTSQSRLCVLRKDGPFMAYAHHYNGPHLRDFTNLRPEHLAVHGDIRVSWSYTQFEPSRYERVEHRGIAVYSTSEWRRGEPADFLGATLSAELVTWLLNEIEHPKELYYVWLECSRPGFHQTFRGASIYYSKID